MNRGTVAILGCGPAGIFAAHAATISGYNVAIFSKKRRSEMFGAQYMHMPLPGLRMDSRTISYKLVGTVDGYRRRVYGDVERVKIEVSPEALAGTYRAWDIRAAYYQLYSQYESDIVHTGEIDGAFIVSATRRGMGKHFTAVVNTIPMPQMCIKQSRHSFYSQDVWAIGDAPERGVECPVTVAPDSVVCNGSEYVGAPEWYRASNIFGYKTVEWPYYQRPSIANGIRPAMVRKPILTNCDCHAGVIRVGRYGKWTKGELSHHAFLQVQELLNADQRTR